MPKKEGQTNQAQSAPPLKNSLKNYRPVEGPENWQLNFGVWWVEHKVLLRRALDIILIAIGAPWIIYGIYGFGYYYSAGMAQDERLANNLMQLPRISHQIVMQAAAQPLVIGATAVFPNSGNTYDLAAAIKNPNADWYANFSYYFAGGAGNNEPQTEFILPQESKYLTSFLNKSASSEAVISEINWHRALADGFNSVADMLKTHTDITVSDIQFNNIGLSSGLTLNSLTFSARNNSPYNYWDVDFYLLAKSGGGLTGINKYRLEKFYSGEEREVSLIWPAYLSEAQIDVQPSVDIFNKDNYMPFKLGPGQEK